MYDRDQAESYLQNVLLHVTGWSRRHLEMLDQQPPAPGSVRGEFVDFPFGSNLYHGQLANVVPRRLHRWVLFIANLFCGQRRPRDIQCVVETQLELILPGVEIRVLSVDILLDANTGDLTKPEAFHTWAAHIRAGRVCVQ